MLIRDSPDWMANLETAYYLYHVHVSMSFLHSPTLASSLYLLWLRFAYRDYADAARLVDSIGTDVEFSNEVVVGVVVLVVMRVVVVVFVHIGDVGFSGLQGFS